MSSQVYRLDTTSKSLSLLNSKLMSDLGYYEVGRTTAKAHVPVKTIQRRIEHRRRPGTRPAGRTVRRWRSCRNASSHPVREA